MSTAKYLQILQREIHSAAIATVDNEGYPEVRIIDIMLADDDSLYFLTARGKEFYRQLMEQRYVALSGTKNNIAISVKGKVRTADPSLLTELFRLNPYMETIYPTGTRSALEVFQLYEGQGEYWDINVRPVLHRSFLLGGASAAFYGYHIENCCTGCGACLKVCPQQCIELGQPFSIRQENCIHCGNCAEACAFGAAKKSVAIEACR